MLAQTRPGFILSSIVLGEWSQNLYITSEGKINLNRKNSPQSRIEPSMLHISGQQAQHSTN